MRLNNDHQFRIECLTIAVRVVWKHLGTLRRAVVHCKVQQVRRERASGHSRMLTIGPRNKSGASVCRSGVKLSEGPELRGRKRSKVEVSS